MTTIGDNEPQHINLNEMLARGGDEAALAFHLLNIQYHVAVIEGNGDREGLEMLEGLLTQHLVGVRALLEEEAGNIEVVAPKLIVPGRS